MKSLFAICAWQIPIFILTCWYVQPQKSMFVIPPGKVVYPTCWYWTLCLQQTAAGTWRPSWSPYHALSEERNTHKKKIWGTQQPGIKISLSLVCFLNFCSISKKIVGFHLWKTYKLVYETMHCEGESHNSVGRRKKNGSESRTPLHNNRPKSTKLVLLCALVEVKRLSLHHINPFQPLLLKYAEERETRYVSDKICKT